MISFEGQIYPDVFLAGASKSGTTFLFDLLSEHSKIQPSSPKEPFFHIDQHNPHNQSNGLLSKESYESFYEPLNSDLLHLDGTSQTIYQTNIIEQLKKSRAKPKTIFVLREPANRILSSFQFTSNNLSAVRQLSFHQYVTLLLESDKKKIGEACRNDKAAFSLQNELLYSRYSFFLEKWRAAIGVDNMLIFLFEEMKSNPELCLERAFHFLDIQKERLVTAVDKVNSSVVIKNRSIHYFLHKAYSLTGYKIPLKKHVKKVYARFQHSMEEEFDYMDDLGKLKEYYKPHNERLATEFNLDLSTWR